MKMNESRALNRSRAETIEVLFNVLKWSDIVGDNPEYIKGANQLIENYCKPGSQNSSCAKAFIKLFKDRQDIASKIGEEVIKYLKRLQ